MAANKNDIMDFDDEQQSKGSIVIAGFEISRKTLIILGIIVLIIIGAAYGNSVIQKNKDAKALAEHQAELEEYRRTHQVTPDDRTMDERMQEALRQQYGNPPEGFKWNFDGTLVALSDESSCEDVIYTYMRALSTLDFATAQRYSENSKVIEEYQDYFGVTSQGITNYYDNFLRKQYKKSLTSLEVLGIGDVAIEANGTEYVTVDIACLDLEDKDFWREDQDMLYAKMYSYQDTEDDQVKAKQYLYDYIYGKYEDGSIGKKKHTIELVCSKLNGKGWLISNDKELESCLSYDNGTDVAQYIINQFRDYYVDRTISESIDDGKEWSDASDYEDKKYDGSENSTGVESVKYDENWEVLVTDDEHTWAFTPYNNATMYWKDGYEVSLNNMPLDIVKQLYEEAFKKKYIYQTDGYYRLYETDMYLNYPSENSSEDEQNTEESNVEGDSE